MFSNLIFLRDEVSPVVEKPRKKSRKKVSKEETTEDQPNPGVRNNGIIPPYLRISSNNP